MTINERNVSIAIKHSSFSQDIKTIPAEWKFLFKTKSMKSVCLCRRVINDAYFYVNKHTHQLICLDEECREKLNIGTSQMPDNDVKKIVKYSVYCDTSIFEDYDDFLAQKIVKHYKKLIKNARGFDELTLLYFELNDYIRNNNMIFLNDIMPSLKLKYDNSHKEHFLKIEQQNRLINAPPPIIWTSTLINA